MHSTNDDSAISMGEQTFIDSSHDSQLSSSPSSSSYVHSTQSSLLKVADNDSSFCDSTVDADDDEVTTSSSPPKQSTYLTPVSISSTETSTAEPSVPSTSLHNGKPMATSSTTFATSSSSSTPSSSSSKSSSLSALFSKTTATTTSTSKTSPANAKRNSQSQQQPFSSKLFVKTFPTTPKPPSPLSSFTSFLQSTKFLNTAIMSTTTILAFPMCIALNEGNEEPINKEKPQQDCKPAESVQKQQQPNIPTTNTSTETITTQGAVLKQNGSNGQVQVYLSNSLADLQNVSSHLSNDDNVQLSQKSSSQLTLNTNAHDGGLLTINAQLNNNNNTNYEKHSNPDLHLSQPIPICMVSSPSPPLPLTTKPPTFPVKSSVVASKSSPAASSTSPKSVTLPTHVLPPHILAAKNSATRRSLGFVQRKMADKKKLSVSISPTMSRLLDGCQTAGVVGISRDKLPLHKRESVLQKSDLIKMDMSPSIRLSVGAFPDGGSDETIVTPYAQLLSSLRSIRNNYFVVANLSPKKSRRLSLYEADKILKHNVINEETKQRIALETLEEIEFCLDKVESMQTHPSAAQMAAHKFSQILNREMSQNPDLRNNGGGSITGYLKTFLEEGGNGDDQTMTTNSASKTAAPQLATNDSNFNKNANKNKAANIFTRLISRENSSERASNDDAVVKDVERFCNNVPLQLKQLVESTYDTWGVDLFEVDALSNHRPLTHVALHLFKQRNILKQFQIRELTFFKFISAIEAKYRGNPYHNNIHATDVLQASHHMLNFSVFKNVFTELEVFAALFAAAVHDVDHPGVTNQYLINTNSDLAILYNDESVLENHHVTLAFQTLSLEGCDVLSTLNRKQHQMFRKMVIAVVLATDMSKHIQHIGHLKTMVEIRRLSSSASSSLSSSITNLHSSSAAAAGTLAAQRRIIDPENAEDKLQILQSLVHCSDLSNPLKPLNLYLQWTDRIMDEFFKQGDLEKSLNLEVSPLCDRENSNICKSQMGFIDYVVHPLWEIWSRLTQPDCQPIMDILESNRVWIASQVLTEEDKHDDDDADDDDDEGDDDVIRDDSKETDDVKNAKRKDGS